MTSHRSRRTVVAWIASALSSFGAGITANAIQGQFSVTWGLVFLGAGAILLAADFVRRLPKGAPLAIAGPVIFVLLMVACVATAVLAPAPSRPYLYVVLGGVVLAAAATFPRSGSRMKLVVAGCMFAMAGGAFGAAVEGTDFFSETLWLIIFGALTAGSALCIMLSIIDVDLALTVLAIEAVAGLPVTTFIADRDGFDFSTTNLTSLTLLAGPPALWAGVALISGGIRQPLAYGLLGALVLVGAGFFAIFVGGWFIGLAVISVVVIVAAIVERWVDYGGMFYVAFGALLLGLTWGAWTARLLLPIATFGLGCAVVVYGLTILATGPVGYRFGYWRDKLRRWVRVLTTAPPNDAEATPSQRS